MRIKVYCNTCEGGKIEKKNCLCFGKGYTEVDLEPKLGIKNVKPYTPTCKFGRNDCICDPEYIKLYHPIWYKKLELDGEVNCDDCEHGECYDDEDK